MNQSLNSTASTAMFGNRMRWFRNLNIRRKLFVGFFVLELIFIAAFIFQWYQLDQFAALESSNSLRMISLNRVNETEMLVDKLYSTIANGVVARDPAQVQASLEKIKPTVEKAITDLQKISTESSIQRTVDDYASNMRGIFNLVEREMLPLLQSREQNALQSIASVNEMINLNRENAFSAVQRISSLLDQENRIQSQDFKDKMTRSKINLFITVLLGFGVGIFFSFYLGTIIRKPLNRLAQQSSAIASGDLTVQITQETTEEIGQMASSFAAMKTNLQQTLSQFTEATAAVASASAEISASTEQMAAGTQEQGQQATDVSSSVEQMSKTIHENSRNATRTVETANSAKQAAVHGGQVVQESITGMKRIASVVNKSAETVRALGQSSNQIGEIISVIDDIADQTNLLALNAAIEAARAGEQGRGFAVVADEVRKLAERTTKATKEITEMIKKIQHDTGDAVSSMEQGTREVEQGIKLADAAGSSLQTIVEISQKVTDMISQIAVASEQQAGASEEISKSVEGISNVAQETASGIQQIARTAEDLNRLTENLQQLIDRFKLTEERKGIQKPKATTRGPQSRVVVRENGHLVGHQSA